MKRCRSDLKDTKKTFQSSSEGIGNTISANNYGKSVEAHFNDNLNKIHVR